MIKIFHSPGSDVKIAFESKRSDTVTLTAHDLGNGHLEAVCIADRKWEELDWSPRQIATYESNVARCRANEELWRPEELLAKSLEASANRAKSKVRRLCKVMGADTMMTLTYRQNITDLVVTKRHLKEFVRRVTRIIPTFRAVCAFEQQERGAWHVHMACERVPSSLVRSGVKLKSFNVLRAVWRSVTGEAGGNVDLSQGYGKARSPARIAAYLSKYLMKSFSDGEKGSNRWTRFGGIELPKPIRLGQFPSMLSAITASFSLVDEQAVVVNQHLGKWQDVFFLVVEGQLEKSAC